MCVVVIVISGPLYNVITWNMHVVLNRTLQKSLHFSGKASRVVLKDEVHHEAMYS